MDLKGEGTQLDVSLWQGLPDGGEFVVANLDEGEAGSQAFALTMHWINVQMTCPLEMVRFHWYVGLPDGMFARG